MKTVITSTSCRAEIDHLRMMVAPRRWWRSRWIVRCRGHADHSGAHVAFTRSGTLISWIFYVDSQGRTRYAWAAGEVAEPPASALARRRRNPFISTTRPSKETQ